MVSNQLMESMLTKVMLMVMSVEKISSMPWLTNWRSVSTSLV